MSDSRPTPDQRRAQHAWKTVECAVHTLNDNAKKDFAREAKRLPVRIKTAGLGQTLAFLLAKAKSDKGEDARDRLLVALGDWLLKERLLASQPNGAIAQDSLIQAIIKGDANFLRRATEEALLYLQWLTRFSEAELGTGELSDGSQP